MNNFRPTTFDEIIGQDSAKQIMKIKINAYKQTGISPGHLLILGSSGLGKTTLVKAMATAMGVQVTQIMGNAVKTSYDLILMMRRMDEGGILFIDEIHTLPTSIQEDVLECIEDFAFDVFVSKTQRGKEAFKHRFTIIGATTHEGELLSAFRNRFKEVKLVPYSVSDLSTMVKNAAAANYNIKQFPDNVATYLARLARGNARGVVNLLTNFMEIFHGTGSGVVDNSVVDTMLRLYSLDPIIGLDRVSRAYLSALANEDRPTGVSALATLINEQEETVKHNVEPYLMSDIMVNVVVDGIHCEIDGPLVERTGLGRVITEAGLQYLNNCKSLQNDGWMAGEKISSK